MRRLKDRRVLITGAARGIGRRLAFRFAAEGAEVLLSDILREELDGTVAAVRQSGGRARGYVFDVTDRSSVVAARERIHADGGPVDVLVNNAGVVFGGTFLDLSPERHETTFRVNVLGVVHVTQTFLPDLVARPEGHLVNMASAAGLVGLPFGASYASSKWAVIGLSESLRLELAQLGHHHVGVTAVCPSYVDTGLFQGVRPPRATRLLDPDRVARHVVRAVKRNRAWMREPWLVKVTPLLRATLPTAAFDRLARAFGVTSGMAGWKGRTAK